MSISKISSLLALSLISSPLSTTVAAPTHTKTISISSPSKEPSYRTSTRRMNHLLATPPMLQPSINHDISALPAHIQPPSSHHIDASLPSEEDCDQVVGIYGNILYPEDQELAQESKIFNWIKDHSKNSNTPFPLSIEELTEISLFALKHFPFSQLISKYFTKCTQDYLQEGQSLEIALENAKQKTLIWSQEVIQDIPTFTGRHKILIARLTQCASQIEKTTHHATKIIQQNPEKAFQSLEEKKSEQIEAPFTWDMRTNVFKQLIDKVISASPNSPCFLALQEVTPQALNDLKQTLVERDLQWISVNNISGEMTLAPREEKVLGEATAFTSTIALSRDLEVLKIKLGDLPTESGSIRKILGVRVRNSHTNKVFTIFTTHTDHQIQNDIYMRTAAKIHEFAINFFQDAPDEQQFVIGGDLNVFDQLGGGQYIERLRKLFAGSKDFRETDYYAPTPIAWSSFIGRPEDPFASQIFEDGILDPNSLDQLIVGSGIELQSAAREAAVYNESGKLLDYYTEKDEYIANLQKRICFSDHFFNIVRFK